MAATTACGSAGPRSASGLPLNAPWATFGPPGGPADPERGDAPPATRRYSSLYVPLPRVGGIGCHAGMFKPALLSLADHGLRAIADCLADEIHFFLPVGSAVAAENVLEPPRRLPVDVGRLPGIPRQEHLPFSRNQARSQRRNTIFLRDGENRLNGAALAARQKPSAQHGPPIRLQPLDALLEFLRPFVVLERDDVGALDLDFLRRPQLVCTRPIALPHAAGDRLRGQRGAGVIEKLRQQRQHFFILVDRLGLPERSRVQIVGLVPQVPRQNALIDGKRRDDFLDIREQALRLRPIGQALGSGALRP